jgi:acetoacetyl-CoA synthetase
VVEELPEIADSLVVELPRQDIESELVLFVRLADGATLDDALRGRIRTALRRELSPRHTPDRIFAVAAIPKTLNGKKLEIPVKRLLGGATLATAVSEGAVADPASLTALLEVYRSESAKA